MTASKVPSTAAKEATTGNTDEGRRRRLGIDHGDDLDAAFERADARDLGEIGRAGNDNALEGVIAGNGKNLGALGACPPEERKRDSRDIRR